MTSGYALEYIVRDGEISSTISPANQGDEVIVEKGGTIQASGNGIYLSQNGQSAFNNGTISITGDSFSGIYLTPSASPGVVNNTGYISVTGNLSAGIQNNGAANPFITNSGQISVSGSGSAGIIDSGNATIINSGSISASGSNTSGAYFNGRGLSLPTAAISMALMEVVEFIT